MATVAKTCSHNVRKTAAYILEVLAIIASALLIGGCNGNDANSQEVFEEGIPVEVNFSLSSRSNSFEASRGDGTPADPVDDNEKINDWFIVFVDKNNKVSKILSRKDAVVSTPNYNPMEQETFRCILPSGTYSIYAFANMTETELQAATGISFTEGSTITPSEIDGKEWTTELNCWDISKPIPMTGFLKNVVVRNTMEETFSIEVVRMVAKVEFKFSNPSDKAVSIHSVSFDPVTTSNVSLFPRNKSGISYDHLGNGYYSALPNATYDKIIVDFSSPVTVTSGTTQEKSVTVYIKESISRRANDGAFTVGINVSYADGIQEHQQYNITKDIKEYINRNDWIVIPITLSGYDVKAEVSFYPPIGGYPAVLSTTDPDGSQIFTFGTEGEFVIVPYVIDKISGIHLLPKDYTLTLGTLEGDEIFEKDKKPQIAPNTSSSLPHEILGTLSTAKGKAKIPIIIKIGDKTYTRIIYLIRE